MALIPEFIFIISNLLNARALQQNQRFQNARLLSRTNQMSG